MTIFILSGCGEQPIPQPQKPECHFPKLPIYATPISRKFKVVPLDENKSVIENETLIELVRNNSTLRSKCRKYALINRKVNREYNK